MMYKIVWHNRLAGAGGESDILYTSLEQAKQIAAKADKDNKDIIHIVVAASS